MADEHEVKEQEETTDVGPLVSEPESDLQFHRDMDKAGDGFWQKFGEPDKRHFVLRAQSDSVFAVRVIEALLAEKFGDTPIDYSPALEPQSPQESNVTGVMDNTGDTPHKADIPGTTDVPPPATV